MATTDNILQPNTLHEAINIITFLNTSHKEEITKWKEAYQTQAAIIKRLESNRKKELEFLSSELRSYELGLTTKSEAVAQKLKEKDDIIHKQLQAIEMLNKRLKIESPEHALPDINVLGIDSNSDSGIVLENEESDVKSQSEGASYSDIKQKKYGRRFAESISFLRRVDFTSRKYKTGRDHLMKQDETDDLKKSRLEIPISMYKRVLNRQCSNDRAASDDDRGIVKETLSSKGSIEDLFIRTKPFNDSMNNHFSDDGSEDTSEEIFDRVMTRSSIRRSVKANPKYKKISRTKSKLLEQVKNNIVD